MQVLRIYRGGFIRRDKPVVALGNFDGIHLGHQAVIARAAAIARDNNSPLMVMTFEPHPRRVFSPQLPPLRLYQAREKLSLLRQQGVDVTCIVRFTRQFAQTPPERFIEEMLVGAIGANYVVTGANFAFGHQRAGNSAFMQNYAEKLGFGYTALAPVDSSGVVCSSSAIREALSKGEVRQAAAMLGRNYTIRGRVRHGEKRGRKLGFPTANLAINNRHLPAFGVYAVRLHMAGFSYPGVANLGEKPTFGQHDPVLEVHVFDIEQDFYEKIVEVELIEFIRPEQRFDSIDALKTQIMLDCEKSRSILAGLKL